MTNFFDDTTGDAENDALWAGELPMQKVLQTLLVEIERSKNLVAKLAETEKNIAALDNIRAIQCEDGHWNFGPYSCGLANGLILAMAIIRGEKYHALPIPNVWKNDSTENKEKE